MKDTIHIQSLFKQIANDNPKAFQLFFDYTYTKLYRYTSYFIDDKDLCKDVISDVYLYFWQNRKTLPEIQDYENYLFICVRNQCLRYLKETSRFQKVRLEDTDISALSDKTNPEQKALDEELKDIIELAINSLPERCRLIFFMVREENMKYKDVADILSISYRTVHAQMCIAIRKVGDIIREYHSGKNITNGKQ